MMIRPYRRQVIVLLAVIAVGAYLRFWNIEHTFNVIHDFDEGVYALGARLILDGSFPYRDFVLIHPPLYSMMLSAAYAVFGIDFLVGRFASAVLSVACVLLMYVAGRLLYHRNAGIAAAALFAVSDLAVYMGRRGVQESLGLFLILLAIVLALLYLSCRRRRYAVAAGVLIGLCLATKYIFIAGALGLVGGLLVCTSGDEVCSRARRLGSLGFWGTYAGLSLTLYACVLLLKRLVLHGIAVPLLDPLPPTAPNLAVVLFVFVLPLPLTTMARGVQPASLWRGVLSLGSGARTSLLLLCAGAAVAFLLSVGPLAVLAPSEYVRQTLGLHGGRAIIELPSIAGIVRQAPLGGYFLTMASLVPIAALPVALATLNRPRFSRSDAFVGTGLLISFLVCQMFPPMSRYYISLYPFVFLGLSWMVPAGREESAIKARQAGTAIVVGLFLLSLSSSVFLLGRYSPDESVRGGSVVTPDERAYREVAEWLEREDAHKVFATNPTYLAFTPGIAYPSQVDPFAVMFLEHQNGVNLLADLRSEGVDYVLLDPWLTYWGDTYWEGDMFARAVRQSAGLVHTVEYGRYDHVEIYSLDVEPGPLFNGEFQLWDRTAGVTYPAGWTPFLARGEGDAVGIEQRFEWGRECVGLTLFESGQNDPDLEGGAQVGIYQRIPLPEQWIEVQVLSDCPTVSLGSNAHGPAIHFVDDEGRAVIVGFDEDVSEEELHPCDECDMMAVMKPWRRGEWNRYLIPVRHYWSMTSWPMPEELTMVITVSANGQHAGSQEFLVAEVVFD